MKTQVYLVGLGIALLVLLGSAFSAHAWYDPGAQRWLNRDPIGGRGFEAVAKKTIPTRAAEFWEGPNLYRFAKNDPTDAVDPWGLSFGEWWCKHIGWFCKPKPPQQPKPPEPPKKKCEKCEYFRNKLLNAPERNDQWESDCQDFCLWTCGGSKDCVRSCNDSCLAHELPSLACVLTPPETHPTSPKR